MRRNSFRLSSLIAGICVGIYLAALVFTAVKIATVISERRVKAEREFREISALVSAGDKGFMDEVTKNRIQEVLAQSETLQGLIVFGSDNTYPFEREPGIIIPVNNGREFDFVRRLGFSKEPFFTAVPNAAISALYSIFDYQLFITIFKQSLIAILIAFCIAFSGLLVQFFFGKSVSFEPTKKDSFLSDFGGEDDDFDLPELDVEDQVDALDFSLPELNLEEQADALDFSLPELDFDDQVDTLDFSLPELDSDDQADELDFSLPDDQTDALDFSLPEASFDTQVDDLDFSLPEADSDTQVDDLDFSLPEADSDTQTDDLDFSLPEADSDTQADDLDFSLPEADSDTQADEPAQDYASGQVLADQTKTAAHLSRVLQECAAADNDLACLIIESKEVGGSDSLYQSIAGEALAFFGVSDGIFQKDERGMALVLPGETLEGCRTKAETFHQQILDKHGDILWESSDLCIGISARQGRDLDADRLLLEASSALKKALADPSNPIVAFKVDPERYKAFLDQKK